MSIEQTLRDAYLAANGWQSTLCTEIDPRDEMYQYQVERSHRPESPLLDYIRRGHEAFLTIEHVTQHTGTPLRECGRVLDFASGYGRLTRFLADALGPDKVWASDIDAGGAAFAQAAMGVHGFPSCTEPSQLDLPSGFDVIFVGSMFSHLPRARFVEWLPTLLGALAPTGSLLFSTHGERANREVAKDPSGFTFIPQSETERLDGAEYGTTYVTPAIVDAIAKECGVAQLTVLEQDLWNLQDLYVARHTPAAGLDALGSTPTIGGRIEEVRFPKPKHAWLCGWASTVARDGPIREVRIGIDGKDVTEARLGEPRELEPAEANRDARIVVEWYTEGDASWLEPGMHYLTAIAHAEGRSHCIDAAPLPIE